MVGATASFRNNVVNGEITEGEFAAAADAPALLLAEQNVLVLPVLHRRVDVGTPGYVGAGCTSWLWNRSPMDCCKRMFTNSTALGEMSMPVQRLSWFSENVLANWPA